MASQSTSLDLVPSLAAWYDAADHNTIDSINDVVREWLDKSRNGWDLKPAAALGKARSPIYSLKSLNGLPAIEFNGSSPFLRTINPFPIVGNDARSVFVVASGGIPNHPGSVVHWGLAERSRAYGVALEENVVLYRWSNNLFLATNDHVTPALVSATYDGLTQRVWLNGYLAAHDVHETDTALTELQVGGRGTNMYPGVFNGQIGEIIIFSRSLSERERIYIEGSLAWKWGLESYLPPVHPFATISPLDAHANARLL